MFVVKSINDGALVVRPECTVIEKNVETSHVRVIVVTSARVLVATIIVELIVQFGTGVNG
jgi:hypothetical protein